jgi:hypothetical protein
MAVLLDRGPPELQRWTEQVIVRLDDPEIHHVLPPFAAARVDRSGRSFTQLLETRTPPRDDAEVTALFSLARAGIRIAMAISSPWFFSFTRDVARRARWASGWQAARQAISDAEAAKARADFARLKATLFSTGDGFSVHEIIETQALVDGLQASMVKPDALAVYRLALELYRDSPQSLRVLSLLNERLGVDKAVALAPRLCAVALQHPLPSLAFSDIWSGVDKWCGRIDQLLEMSAERFFEAWRLDPANASRSTRERRVERRRTPREDRRRNELGDATFIREQRQLERRRTPAAASSNRQSDQPILEAGGWGETIRPYFDAYEALPDVETRLLAAVHPMRPAPGSTEALFMPAWAIYTDGRVATLRPRQADLSAYARWVSTTVDLLDGIAWLNDAPSDAPRPDAAPPA